MVRREVNQSLLKKECEFRTYQDLFTEMVTVKTQTDIQSDTNRGSIRLLVQRPGPYMRQIVREAKFSVEGGMEGSGWVERKDRGKSDQICVMSVDAIRTITNCEDENIWAAAGDQIFMDFDLTKDNLHAGDRIIVGDADEGVILEVTERPHNGCSKFSKRYGIDALKIVNCPEGKAQRLRGIYFKVIRDGIISQGDGILKI